MVTSRRILLPILALLLGTVAGLAAIEIGLRSYASYVRSREQMDPGFLIFDPQIGWRMAANWSGRHRHYDFDVSYSTNEQGLRGPWPASSAGATPAATRHLFLGDSFTFGLGVNDNETFVQRLGLADPSTIYLNAAVAGFSTDQEFLLLKERLAEWHVDKMTLVVYLANDLFDNTLRYPLQANMGKPLFTLESGTLQLMNVPVLLQPKPEEEQRRTLATVVLGEEAARRQETSWMTRWQIARSTGLAEKTSSEALAQIPERLRYPMDLFVRLIQEMHHLSEANHVAMSVLLMPGRSYVELPESFSAQFQEFLRAEIVRRQSELGVPVTDLMSQLRAEYPRSKQRLFYPNEGHLTAVGHQVVADLLRKK